VRIEQLEYLAAVTRHGSLRRASERLHVSPPALSEAVGKLERELGVTLLDRHRSGTRISDRGQELLGPMLAVLEAVERLRAAAAQGPEAPGVVRLGTTGTGTTSVVAPAVRALRAASPAVEVEVSALAAEEVRRRLLDGALDLGLVDLLVGEDAPTGLTATHLGRSRPVVLLPPGHRLAAYAEVPLDLLRAEPLVVGGAGSASQRLVDRLFAGGAPQVSCTVGGEESTIRSAVAGGLGVAVVAGHSAGGPSDEVPAARPLAGMPPAVALVLLEVPGRPVPRPVRDLRVALAAEGRAMGPV
jgi:DNA-binding transcriptional LysR family regulator